MKIADMVNTIGNWTVNITNEIHDIVKEGVNQMVKDEVIKLINESRTNFDVDEKIGKIKTELESNFTRIDEQRMNDQKVIKDEIKGIDDSIEAINLSRNQLKDEILNDVKSELDTIRNASNYRVVDDERMFNMINQLENEKDQMSHKLIDNEQSVDNLSKRIFISLAITLLLLVAFVITIGYKYYYERKSLLEGYKRHSSPSNRSEVDSVQDEYV